MPSSRPHACVSTPSRSRSSAPERQRPRRVHARAERRQDAHAPVADLVAEALDHDRAVARAARPWPRAARAGSATGCAAARSSRRGRATSRFTASRLGQRAGLAHERADRRARARAGGPAPRRCQNGILPGSPGAGETSTRSRVISLDAPRRRAEHEHLADARLEDHLLVQLADARPRAVGAGTRRTGRGRGWCRRSRPPAGARSRGRVTLPACGPRRCAAAARRSRRTGSGPTACRARPRTARAASSRTGSARRTSANRSSTVPLVGRARSPRSAAPARRAGCAARASPRPRPSCMRRGDGRDSQQVAAVLREDAAACDGAPTWWPARPMRCRPRATEGGASICTTRSTAPMSMPSSSDEVATSARQRRRASAPPRSACALLARDRAVVGAGELLAGQLVQRSAGAPRAAVVDEHHRRAVCARRARAARGWMAGQIVVSAPGRPALSPVRRRVAAARVMSSTGTSTSRSSSLLRPGIDDRDGTVAVAAEKRATSSSGRCVADRPMRCSSRAGRSRRGAPATAPGASRAWWPPRAWISSTITAVDRAQHLARARRREQQVQRLGRGDQHVGRAPQHRLPLGLRACRRCARRRAMSGSASPRRSAAARDAGERRAQVALDVVRRAPSAARRRAGGRRALRGARLGGRAGRGRSGTPPASCPSRSARQQRVRARRDRRPALRLRRGRAVGEGVREPRRGGRGEQVRERRRHPCSIARVRP